MCLCQSWGTLGSFKVLTISLKTPSSGCLYQSHFLQADRWLFRKVTYHHYCHQALGQPPHHEALCKTLTMVHGYGLELPLDICLLKDVLQWTRWWGRHRTARLELENMWIFGGGARRTWGGRGTSIGYNAWDSTFQSCHFLQVNIPLLTWRSVVILEISSCPLEFGNPRKAGKFLGNIHCLHNIFSLKERLRGFCLCDKTGWIPIVYLFVW